MEMVAEGHVLAEKTGLGVEILQKLIATVFPAGPSMIYSKRMSSGYYSRGQVGIYLLRVSRKAYLFCGTARGQYRACPRSCSPCSRGCR